MPRHARITASLVLSGCSERRMGGLGRDWHGIARRGGQADGGNGGCIGLWTHHPHAGTRCASCGDISRSATTSWHDACAVAAPAWRRWCGATLPDGNGERYHEGPALDECSAGELHALARGDTRDGAVHGRRRGRCRRAIDGGRCRLTWCGRAA